MSRFKYIYAPIAIIKLTHADELATESNVKIYPNATTEKLFDKHKLLVKMTPEGFVVLYKKQEEFVAETVDNVLIIDGEEVIDKKIVGYTSTMPDPTYANWLPEVIDLDLEFYAIANQKYRNDTNWNNLPLNDFVVYSSTDLTGTITSKTTINEKIQPDAILQLNITAANIATPAELTFEINKT
ncbi:hypothetical protein U8527_13810 [Kordia algicida OT-1]|uniref:Uncharacterized protein n=1 Tax=Kordia algicida OT-1 TaxID=391587 RepID=A9DX99_9FLAO|nr:hypothetical protein [Kordia algicida]EDP95978.1 hypothetical protein KAOT1_07413 [Kordia algicida OT-1]